MCLRDRGWSVKMTISSRSSSIIYICILCAACYVYVYVYEVCWGKIKLWVYTMLEKVGNMVARASERGWKGCRVRRETYIHFRWSLHSVFKGVRGVWCGGRGDGEGTERVQKETRWKVCNGGEENSLVVQNKLSLRGLRSQFSLAECVLLGKCIYYINTYYIVYTEKYIYTYTMYI